MSTWQQRLLNDDDAYNDADEDLVFHQERSLLSEKSVPKYLSPKLPMPGTM